MSKISSNCFNNITYETKPLSPELETILKGKFTYFGRGLQSFCFLSEDGNYVLKIFNNKMQKNYAFFKKFSKEKANTLQKKIERTFKSYQIAEEELKNETAFLYFHPVKSSILQKKVILVDKLGIEHNIDLDKTGFILQKKAILVYPWLKKLIEQGKMEEAKNSISSLVNLFLFKFKKGIADSDPLIRTNFGFLDGNPIQIDVGPFSKDPKIQDKKVYLPEILRITASLEDWLLQNCPELALHLKIELDHAEKSS